MRSLRILILMWDELPLVRLSMKACSASRILFVAGMIDVSRM